MALVGSVNGAKTEMNNSWGTINYTTFSHFDVTYDQLDLKRNKAARIEGGLRIPIGVTRVYLELPGSLNFIEFPETVKYINKDIFSKCNVKAVLLSNKTIESLLKKDYGENDEENIRKYFSLNDNTEIIIGKIIGMQDNLNKIQNNIPKPPLHIKPNNPKNNFLDEIHTFDKDKLKHIEEKNSEKKKNNENKFTDEINNFDKNKLKHVEETEKNDKKTENPFLDEIHNFDKNKLKHHEKIDDRKPDNSTLDSLHEAMEKRRADLEPDEYVDDEPEWED